MERWLPWLCLLLASADWALGHKYHWHRCPRVVPEDNFNMTRFLGTWYVMEMDAEVRCYQYDFSQGNRPGEYLARKSWLKDLGMWTFWEPGQVLRFASTGLLTRRPQSTSASMTLTFPFSSSNVMSAVYERGLAQDWDFQVFLTDYTSYAGVVACQDLEVASRSCAAILSRTPSPVPHNTLRLMMSRLEKFGYNSGDLRPISHVGCDYRIP